MEFAFDLAQARVRWRTWRSPASAHALLGFADSQGMAGETTLFGTSLTREDLADSVADIEAWKELRIVHNIVAALGDDNGLGIAAAQHYCVTSHGFWSLALLSSVDLRTAAKLSERYNETVCSFHRASLAVVGDEAHFVFDNEHIPPHLRRFLAERDSALTAAVRRAITGSVPFQSRVTFQHTAPSDTSRYVELFGYLPEFGGTHNVTVFPAAYLDRPLPNGNLHTQRLAIQQCEQQRSRLSPVPEAIAERVLERLHLMGDRTSDMNAMARALGMSARTLRRQLQRENTTYREIVDRYRLSRAVNLLMQEPSPLAHVAEQVGYANLPGFLQAFKRMTGMTPTEYRRRHA